MNEIPEDEMEIIPQISVKPILPSIPTDDKELRELKEDLRAMGCGKLLILPWNVESEKDPKGVLVSEKKPVG